MSHKSFRIGERILTPLIVSSDYNPAIGLIVIWETKGCSSYSKDLDKSWSRIFGSKTWNVPKSEFTGIDFLKKLFGIEYEFFFSIQLGRAQSHIVSPPPPLPDLLISFKGYVNFLQKRILTMRMQMFNFFKIRLPFAEFTIAKIFRVSTLIKPGTANKKLFWKKKKIILKLVTLTLPCVEAI